MSNKFSLDSFRDAANQKFGSTIVEDVPGGDVELVNPLRLPKTKRKGLSDAFASLKDDDVDEAAIFESILRLAAANPKDADRLIKAVGGDVAVLVEVITAYGQEVQAGEASPSQS